MDDELLVNTRKKRANAGSRLKQLLSAEEPAEEEDVDLLFVEDDDDREYNSESEEEEQEEGSDEEEENERAVKPKKRSREATAETEGDEEEEGEENEGEEDSDEDAQPQQDDDEMFSDSSEESSEEESDEGEKELQKQERAKKREKSKKQKQRLVPQIKKPIEARKPAKKKVTVVPKAETLLDETRRQSSRRIAVQSKLTLVEKLKDEEKRRSSLKPVQRIEYKEMTQEERLAEALETEKYNISTLNKYQEQEVINAKRRRELMMNKRRKLTDVMTIKTCVKFVEIEEEREYEKFLLTRDVYKKKDRRGRKSEKQKKEEEEERIREERMRERWELLNNPEKAYVVGEDKSEPLSREGTEEATEVKEEMMADSKTEETPMTPDVEGSATPAETATQEPSGENKEKEKSEEEKKTERAGEKEEGATSEEQGTPEVALETTTDEPPVDEADTFVDASETTEFKPLEEAEAIDKTADRDVLMVDAAEEVNKETTEEATPVIEEQSEDVKMENANKETTEEATPVIGERPEDVKMEDATAEIPEAKEETTEPASTTTEVKSVKFADDEDDKAEVIPPPKPEPPKIVYQGPKQKVGINLIAFENPYKKDKLKSILLGEQAILPLQRRSTEVEPLVRIKQDPLAVSVEPTSTLKAPDLSVLDSFPEFGNFEKVHREITTTEVTTTAKVVLKTEAPTGMYLPNGQRKTCLITGKPAMYFDPKTGMPYADVESYKVIKEIQEGKFKWVEGGYVSNYYAKGAPPGFVELLK